MCSCWGRGWRSYPTQETAVVPVCQSADSGPDYAAWTTRLFISPDGSDFYLTVGFGRQCLQRWDAQGLKPIWSAELPDDFSPSVAEVPPVFGAGAAHVADGHTLASFSREGGAVRTLLVDEDYEFHVLAVHGDDVIVQARRQRGTTRYEIWAVDGDREPADGLRSRARQDRLSLAIGRYGSSAAVVA